MKVVALVSGGKDSCFNILHCLANGHEVVALANLRPADREVQELDSFMFQTVGHDALDLYSECTGLPMYRGDITGTSKNQQLDYKHTQDDEIEDLFKLLKQIRDELGVEAVSVGAILSSYQRTRVEDVCARLGMTSLAYLWQRDQLELMAEMCESTMDARLIKVAAVGLNETHLGQSLKQMFATLVRLNKRFEVHICGEGGEFETLVLDCPFFTKRLQIVSSEITKEDGGVAYYHPSVISVDKDDSDSEYHSVREQGVDWSKFIPGSRSLLKDRFQHIYDLLEPTEEDQTPPTAPIDFTFRPVHLTNKIGNRLYISNLSSQLITVEDQVNEVFEQLERILLRYNISTSHIQHSTLLISSMSEFAKINSIYVKHFSEPLPPSRVCVQTQLPTSQHLQLSVVTLVDHSHKTGLHVQGRSYWAPANIGPYSQTIIDDNLVATLSGQIPLIPSSMALCDKGSRFNAVLSLQHFDNVKEVVGCVNQLNAVCFIKADNVVPIVSQVWAEYSDDYNPLNSLLIVQVDELPRGADVEWGGLSYKKASSLYEDDEEHEVSQLLHTNLSLQGSSYSNGKDVVSTLALTKDQFAHVTFHAEYHYTVYTNTPLEVNASVDCIPVRAVWDYKGASVDYGVVIRA